MQQQNIAAQAEEQRKTNEAQALTEVQKQEAISAANVKYEQAKNQFELQRMQTEWQFKQQELQTKFQHDLQLKEMEVKAMREKEGLIEDRKDKRIKIQGTQQSKMIDQRNHDLMPTNFEREKPGPTTPAI